MRSRRALVWLLLGAAVLALLAWAAANRRNLLEAALLDELRERGVEPAALSVERFDHRGISLANVRLGDDDLSIESLEMSFSPAGIRARRLDALRVVGLRVHGVLDASGVHLGALDPLVAADPTATPAASGFPALPSARIEVDDARFVLDTEAGPYVATLAIDLDAAGDGHLALAASAFPGLDTRVALGADAFALTGSVSFRPERLHVALEPAPFRLALAGEAGPTRLAGTTPALELTAAAGGDAQFALSGGALQLPDQALALREIEASGSVAADTGLPDGRLRIGELRDTGKEARFPALALDARYRPDGDSIRFEGQLEGAKRALRIDISGAHALPTGSGQAEFALVPLQFAADGLTLHDVLPSLAALVESADGGLAATGSLSWGGEPLAGFVDVGLRDLTLRTPAAVFERLNAALRIDDPWQPRMPAGQLLSMARLDFGLELTNGLVEFELRRDGVLDVASATWQLAGGELHTQGSFDERAPEQTVVLRVSDVELEQLLSLANLEGLSGSGRLQGELPLVLRGGEIEIRGGVLEASSEGGWIRYVPEGSATEVASAAGAAFDDLLVALRNFRYDKLRLGLDGDAAGEVALALSLHGNNPEHRDRQPYEFNLNVESQLADLLAESEAVYRIPARIEQRVGEIAAGLE